MPSKLKNEPLTPGWRSHLIFLLLLIMMTALFFSRALLSASMIAFVIISFLHKDLKGHIRNFLASPLLWAMTLLFLLPFLSGAWSSDTDSWLDTIRIKLPLLFLPLAFAGPVVFTKKQWQWTGYIFILLVTGGTVWCMIHYITHFVPVNEGYLRAKTIRTPLENDHVRFSLLVAVAILLAGWVCIKEIKNNRTLSVIMGIAAVWLIVFLHILAARTGLFSFYLIGLCTAVWLIIHKLKWRYGLLVLGFVIALPVIAYYIIPTFQNRVKYIRYEFDFFKHADYRPGFNDGVRVISIRAGWDIMKQNPAGGTGFGDIRSGTNEWYQKHYPQMIPADRIYPSSEWLMYGTGAGIPGLLVFSFVMVIPFFTRTSQPLVWGLLNMITAFSFLFDIGLEIQFGVCAYALIILCFYRRLKLE